jgi:hypothetical protein
MTSSKSIRKSQFRTASRLLELEKAVWELSKGCCCWRRKLNMISASRVSFLNVVVLRTRPGWVENLALYLCEHNLSQPVADCLSIPLLYSPRTPCITRWGRISEQVSGLTNNRNSPGCESRDRERERERVQSQDYGNSDYNRHFVLSVILILLSIWSFLHTSFVICAFYSGGRTDCVGERGSGDDTKQGRTRFGVVLLQMFGS